MGTTDGGHHILRHIATDGDSGRSTTIGDTHGVILHCRFVNGHCSYLTKSQSLAHNSHCLTIRKGHIASLSSGKQIGDAAHADMKGLSKGREGQHKGSENDIQFLHFTIILKVFVFVITT